ncbi:hypothetical protein ACQKPC_09555 [Pseudomonas sp. NPDC089918]|uniref:hypothetical protein n=1 Tax=Pseudomonas sp. NPDC089918 TaxID=3390654 RepID=UPI003D07DDE1
MTSIPSSKFYFLDKLTVAIVSICVAMFFTLASLNLTLAPSYFSFIVGNITWDANSKLQDLIAAPVFIFTLLFSLWFFKTKLITIKTKTSQDEANSFVKQLLIWSIPAAMTFGSSLIGLPFDIKLFYLSILGIIYFLLISLTLTKSSTKLTSNTASIALFSIILISLAPLELALTLGRLPASIGHTLDIKPTLRIAYILLTLGVIALLFTATYRSHFLEKLTPFALLFGQTTLSTLFLCFYPARLITPTGAITKYSTTPLLKIVLILLVALCVLDIIRRHINYQRNKINGITSLISPLAIFALLIVFKAGVTAQPLVSPDDYHFGEHLLGWWQYLKGAVPYVDYMPAHGIIGDDLPGLLAYVFYEGTAANIAEAARFATLLLSLVAFLALYKFSQNYLLAFIAILLLGGFSQSTNLSWLFLVPFLCLWLDNSLIEKHAKWLSIWLLTAPIAILGVPPQGLLITFASAPIGLYVLWKYWKSDKFTVGRGFVVLALGVIVLLSATSPFLSMLFNAVRYVLENGPINQIAYGVPWSLSWNGGPRSGFIFEAVRMSWVFVPVIALITIYNHRHYLKSNPNLILPAVVVVALSLLLIPYSMGRIDPSAGSRPATSGILGWTILVPLAIWHLTEARIKAGWILFGVTLSSTVNVFPPSLNSFVFSFSSHIPVGHLFDGEKSGFPNIGTGSIQIENINRLKHLKALFDAKLSPNESYLDLTSRNAQYFYLNRPPLLSVTAVYNMVPLEQQRRAIKTLIKAKPRMALLEGANIIHDGGGLALRTPLLYHYIVENYLANLENGFIVGYLKSESDSISNVVQIPTITTPDSTPLISKNSSKFKITIDPDFSNILNIGQTIKLLNTQYTITNIDKNIITISSDIKLTKFESSEQTYIEAELTGESINKYRSTLMQKSFGSNDFKKIPIAWGRSLKSLESKLNLLSDLSSTPFSTKDFSGQGESLRVSGPDPQLIYDVSSLALSGKTSGMLRFDFSCEDKQQEPRIQLFWWGDTYDGPNEALSVKFNAEDGSIVVPLEALPLWLTMKTIAGLRIDLDNPAACTSIKLKHLALYKNNTLP